MPPEQLRRRQIHQAALILIDQPAALDADMPLLACRMQRRAHAVRLRFDHRHRFRRLLGANTGMLRLMMAAFSPAIAVSELPKKFGVIHADRRDDGRERRVDHIGGVQPSAETHFQQHDIGRVLREQAKCRRGLDFEDRDRLACLARSQCSSAAHNSSSPTSAPPPAAADAKAFVDPHQIGRGDRRGRASRRLPGSRADRRWSNPCRWCRRHGSPAAVCVRDDRAAPAARACDRG